jgi:hypothetical protein
MSIVKWISYNFSHSSWPTIDVTYVSNLGKVLNSLIDSIYC